MTYEFIESPNHGNRNGNQVSGLIGHFTAGGSINSSVRYMCNRVRAPEGSVGSKYVIRNNVPYYNARAASHYCTSREGYTVQMVQENRAAWHAGSSKTNPKLNNRESLNLWTIGHEICNWGGLREEGGQFYCWPNNWTKLYDGPLPPIQLERNIGEVSKGYLLKDGNPAFPTGTINYWEPYPDKQIAAVIELWSDIINRYGIGKRWVAGHEDVDPTRKIDPGPAFPWNKVLSTIYVINKLEKKTDFLYQDDSSEETITNKISIETQLAERNIDDDRSKSHNNNPCKAILNFFNFGNLKK